MHDHGVSFLGPPCSFDNPVGRPLSPGRPTTLRIKITAKRQVTFPAAALKALRVKPGDTLELVQDKDNWRLAPAGVDFTKLGTLRSKIGVNPPPLDLAKWRGTPKEDLGPRNIRRPVGRGPKALVQAPNPT